MKKKFSFLILAVIAATASAQVPESLNFNDIAARLGSHETVRQAMISRSMMSSLLRSAEGWKGPRISLTPSVQYSDPDGPMELSQTAMSAEVQIPFGTTEAEKERRAAAGESFILSDIELTAAYGEAYTDLYSFYAQAYLAQQAAEAWEAEVEYTRLKADAIRQKVSRGLLPVSEQTEAESEYQAAAEKLLQSRLDLRLAWFNLAYRADIDTARTGPGGAGRTRPGDSYGAVPRFEAPDTSGIIREATQPSRLMAEARQSLPSITAQRQKVEKSRRELSYRSTWDFDFLPKITFATPDTSASLGFSTAAGTLSAGSSWPFYKQDIKTGSGSEPPDHSLTLALGIAANISAVGASDREALAAAITLEERRLTALEQMSDLQIRSRSAAYIKARDSLAEAERALRNAEEAAAAVQARSRIGQTSPEDDAAGRVLTARAGFNLERARADLASAYLALIGAANAWKLAGVSFSGVK